MAANETNEATDTSENAFFEILSTYPHVVNVTTIESLLGICFKLIIDHKCNNPDYFTLDLTDRDLFNRLDRQKKVTQSFLKLLGYDLDDSGNKLSITLEPYKENNRTAAPATTATTATTAPSQDSELQLSNPTDPETDPTTTTITTTTSNDTAEKDQSEKKTDNDDKKKDVDENKEEKKKDNDNSNDEKKEKESENEKKSDGNGNGNDGVSISIVHNAINALSKYKLSRIELKPVRMAAMSKYKNNIYLMDRPAFAMVCFCFCFCFFLFCCGYMQSVCLLGGVALLLECSHRSLLTTHCSLLTGEKCMCFFCCTELCFRARIN